MTIVKGYFDEFHPTECNIENFEIIERDLIINVKSNLEIYPPHPLADTHKFENSCKVIFKNIKYLRRRLSEYQENKKKYKKRQEFVTEFNQKLNTNIQYNNYGFEGFLLNPPGWLDFEVIAEEFYFDDLKN
ncbi:MAG: hypothetical protein SAJ72_22105 [Jaaginema sp. PMC 1080.18]|nr:hypothetical protein [Jaaginema sp. PMC 1080.18]